MAYGQWVSFSIKTKGFNGVVNNATLSWGKFYKYDNKDEEVDSSQINGIQFTSGKFYPNAISACGRSDAASGTEGSFDIYIDGSDVTDKNNLICKLSWDCPWGSKTNTWGASGYDVEKYIVGIIGGSSYGGAIGNLTVTIADIS